MQLLLVLSLVEECTRFTALLFKIKRYVEKIVLEPIYLNVNSTKKLQKIHFSLFLNKIIHQFLEFDARWRNGS